MQLLLFFLHLVGGSWLAAVDPAVLMLMTRRLPDTVDAAGGKSERNQRNDSRIA